MLAAQTRRPASSDCLPYEEELQQQMDDSHPSLEERGINVTQSTLILTGKEDTGRGVLRSFRPQP